LEAGCRDFRHLAVDWRRLASDGAMRETERPDRIEVGQHFKLNGDET
jgi:hypothetical protein